MKGGIPASLDVHIVVQVVHIVVLFDRRLEALRWEDPVMDTITETCPGCAIELAAVEGPTDPYGGASPACWAMFNEVLAADFGRYEYPEAHRLIVDAYMAQHPGFSSASGRRSLVTHLVGLSCVIELGYSGAMVRRTLARVFPDKQDVEPYEPVPWLGEVTVALVHSAQDIEEHSARARIWAESVWRAWSPYHARIHQLMERAGS